ncbi:unnamed protein product, partial [Nesidiocoris tenuis]
PIYIMALKRPLRRQRRYVFYWTCPVTRRGLLRRQNIELLDNFRFLLSAYCYSIYRILSHYLFLCTYWVPTFQL